jgi:hypothetical protein
MSRVLTSTQKDGADARSSVCDQVKPLTAGQKFRWVGKFALSKYWPHIVAAVLGFAGLGVYVYCSSSIAGNDLLSHYFSAENLISATMQIITFAVVGSMLYKNMEKEWFESLNEFLSVYFKDGEQLRICCRYARLPHQSDIRALGQSLGQSVKSGRLPLAPSLVSAPTVVEIETPHGECEPNSINGGIPFIHHKVTFPLTEEVSSVRDGDHISDPEEKKESKIDLGAEVFFLWDFPFEDLGEHNLQPMAKAPDSP